ncbi:MAG TPA: hypothetical protein VGM02_06105 [Acidobacteriaceae bacterium]|jgi:hypothetical protein
MAIDTSDPMGGTMRGMMTLEELMRKAKANEEPVAPEDSGTGDDGLPVLPSYVHRDNTQSQMHAEDDEEGDLTPETTGPGKPPL